MTESDAGIAMKDALGYVLSRVVLVAVRLLAAVVLLAGAARGDDTVKVFDPATGGVRDVPFQEYLDSLVPRKAVDPVKAWLAQPQNFGSCPCSNTSGGCHCQPHSKCAAGQCSNLNPLLRSNIPAQPVRTSEALDPALSNCPSWGAASAGQLTGPVSQSRPVLFPRLRSRFGR